MLDEKRFNILSTKNTPIRMTSLNVSLPKNSGTSQNPSIVENEKAQLYNYTPIPQNHKISADEFF